MTDKLSKQIRDQFLADREATSSAAKSFESLVAACDFLEKNGVTITIAQVGAITGKHGRKHGALRAQSIRNSKAYSDYVRARFAEQGNVTPMQAAQIRSGDANIDSYIQVLESQTRELRGQVKNLSKCLSNMGVYDLKAALENRTLTLAHDQPQAVSPVVLDAIGTLLTPAALMKVGLELAPTGQIIAPDMAMAILLSKEQVDSLKRFVIGAENKKPPASTPMT